MRMKIFIMMVIFFLSIIILGSCRTLPEPNEEMGILAIKLTTQNTSDDDEYLVNYSIHFRNKEESIFIIPNNMLLLTELPSGSYETEKVVSKPTKLIDEIGDEIETIVNFMIYPKTITIFPYSFDNYQINEGDNWITQDFDFHALTDEDINKIFKKIEGYKNIELWEIRVRSKLIEY